MFRTTGITWNNLQNFEFQKEAGGIVEIPFSQLFCETLTLWNNVQNKQDNLKQLSKHRIAENGEGKPYCIVYICTCFFIFFCKTVHNLEQTYNNNMIYSFQKLFTLFSITSRSIRDRRRGGRGRFRFKISERVRGKPNYLFLRYFVNYAP